MDFATIITIIFALFAIAEVLQVWLLRSAVVSIKTRMDEVLPADSRPGAIIAEAAFDFIDQINTDPQKAAIVGTFISNAGEVAFAKVKSQIPLLGGGDSSALIEKIGKRNPLAALAIEALQVAAPMIQQKLQEQQKGGGNVPPKQSKGGIGYG